MSNYYDRITSHHRPKNTIYGKCKCGKNLTHYEWLNGGLCAECSFHRLNGTDTIKKYNEWFKKDL